MEKALAQEAYAAGRRDADALLKERLEIAERRVEELERRSKLSLGSLPCGGCGGPHRFDTSVPSVLWNQVVRAQGMSDYLCTTCIVRAFAKAGVSFTATLWGDDFGGLPIEVQINGTTARAASLMEEQNTALRAAIGEASRILIETLDAACR